MTKDRSNYRFYFAFLTAILPTLSQCDVTHLLMLLHGGVQFGREVIATVRQVGLLRVLPLTSGFVLLLLLLNTFLTFLLPLRVERVLQDGKITIVNGEARNIKLI